MTKCEQDHKASASSTGIDVEAQDDGQLPKSEGIVSPVPERGASADDFVRRRLVRSNTVQSYPGERHARSTSWHPGGEPGLDPTQGDAPGPDEREKVPPEKTLHQKCVITVVDFSRDAVRMRQFDNDTLESFLMEEKEPWVACRWINVNGISWDVVKLLANHKGLHRLALEDLMHTANRTKVDWYSDQAFIVLAMQKLINLHEDESDNDSDNDNKSEASSSSSELTSRTFLPWWNFRKRWRRKRRGVIMRALFDFLTPSSEKKRVKVPPEDIRGGRCTDSDSSLLPLNHLRSLQRYQGEPNESRIEFLERHSSLAPKSLGVMIEQVSMFLHPDNTVTSFFQASAEDIETPIIRRLHSSRSIMRQSCDASMVVQAILDGITDLFIPVTTAYQDAIGDLELEVLADPNIQQSTSLYILTSEITTLRGLTQPIIGLINSLRDHRSDKAHVAPTRHDLSNSHPNDVEQPQLSKSSVVAGSVNTADSAVIISPMCRTYLGDVLDQCITTTDRYDQMQRSADNMIDLIFNTIGATQNESMKQLALVTCIFLPPTFLTGYFGMNFDEFSGTHNDVSFFWIIVIPLIFVITAILMRETIQQQLRKLAQKYLIRSSRRRRRTRK